MRRDVLLNVKAESETDIYLSLLYQASASKLGLQNYLCLYPAVFRKRLSLHLWGLMLFIATRRVRKETAYVVCRIWYLSEGPRRVRVVTFFILSKWAKCMCWLLWVCLWTDDHSNYELNYWIQNTEFTVYYLHWLFDLHAYGRTSRSIHKEQRAWVNVSSVSNSGTTITSALSH